jgi:hypothetical protein
MHLTNDPGLWQHFVNRPDNIGLPILEVKQKYITEVNTFESNIASAVGDAGAGGGTAPPQPSCTTQISFDTNNVSSSLISISYITCCGNAVTYNNFPSNDTVLFSEDCIEIGTVTGTNVTNISYVGVTCYCTP